MPASGAERVARTPMIVEAETPNQGRCELRPTSEVGGIEGVRILRPRRHDPTPAAQIEALYAATAPLGTGMSMRLCSDIC
jgi:hypothetical protein